MVHLFQSIVHFLNAIDFYGEYECIEFPDIYFKIIAIYLKNKELLRQIDDE